MMRLWCVQASVGGRDRSVASGVSPPHFRGCAVARKQQQRHTRGALCAAPMPTTPFGRACAQGQRWHAAPMRARSPPNGTAVEAARAEPETKLSSTTHRLVLGCSLVLRRPEKEKWVCPVCARVPRLCGLAGALGAWVARALDLFPSVAPPFSSAACMCVPCRVPAAARRTCVTLCVSGERQF